jgi:hypothetical protein
MKVMAEIDYDQRRQKELNTQPGHIVDRGIVDET